jgi:hypothetical protein
MAGQKFQKSNPENDPFETDLEESTESVWGFKSCSARRFWLWIDQWRSILHHGTLAIPLLDHLLAAVSTINKMKECHTT